MFSRNYSKLVDLAYNYLGYKKINRCEEIDLLIFECIDEIEKLNSFKYIYQEYDYLIDVLNKEPYISYLKDCKVYYICAMTLGLEIDKKINYYSITNLLKMYVFDAVSSAYLEYKSDEYEKSIFNNSLYRFCPGYNGSSIEDIKKLYKILKADKIGISLNSSNLMIPQKSMIGIVSVAKNKKSCDDCIIRDSCEYKKGGTKCNI